LEASVAPELGLVLPGAVELEADVFWQAAAELAVLGLLGPNSASTCLMAATTLLLPRDAVLGRDSAALCVDAVSRRPSGAALGCDADDGVGCSGAGCSASPLNIDENVSLNLEDENVSLNLEVAPIKVLAMSSVSRPSGALGLAAFRSLRSSLLFDAVCEDTSPLPTSEEKNPKLLRRGPS